MLVDGNSEDALDPALLSKKALYFGHHRLSPGDLGDRMPGWFANG